MYAERTNYIFLVEDVHTLQILGGLDKTVSHGGFTLSERHAWIVVLLVGLVVAFRVADLALEVVVVLCFVCADTVPEGPLCVGIDVHLDDTSINGILDIFNRRTRTTVEDEEHRLVVVSAELFGDVLLRVVQNDWLEVDVAGSVDTVDVSERSGAGEGSVGDRAKLFVGIHDLFGLCVQTRRVNVRVVDTVFLTTGHTEFELQENVKLGKLLHVFLADGNVLLEGLLGKIKHVRREKGLAVLVVVLLVGGHEAVNPGQPGLLAVVRVQYNRDSVQLGDFTDMLGTSNASSNGGVVVFVGERLSSNELTATLGEGDHDGSTVLGSGFHTRIDRVGSNNVDSWNGPASLLGSSEKVDKSLTSDNTRLDRSGELGEGLLSKRKTQREAKETTS